MTAALLMWVAATLNIANFGGVGDAVTNSLGATGTDNTPAMAAILQAAGTNDTIYFPPGRYLLVPPFMKTNGIMSSAYDVCAAVTLNRGGLSFVGTNATLQLPGAYQLQPYVQRGFLFTFIGPITNDLPVTFDGLTFDGGTYPGFTADHTFPAKTSTGAGWDVTHGAMLDQGAPLNSLKTFRNCRFTHWRGEIVKSASAWEGGFNDFINCTFDDGNASALNFSFSHRVTGCTFDTLYLGMEFYQGYCVTNCLFQDSLLTNISGNALVIVGALANHVEPPYVIENNIISSVKGILMAPAANVTIRSNLFIGQDLGIYTSSSGYQGTDWNHDWIIAGNSFSSVFQVFVNNGLTVDRCQDVIVAGNRMPGCTWAFAGAGISSNIVFSGNDGELFSKLNSSSMTGSYAIDSGSNRFQERDDTRLTVGTNYISYGWGSYHRASSPLTSGVAFALEDSLMIPAGAVLRVRNNGSLATTIYCSSTTFPHCYAASIPAGDTKGFVWDGTRWVNEGLLSVKSVVSGRIRGL